MAKQQEKETRRRIRLLYSLGDFPLASSALAPSSQIVIPITTLAELILGSFGTGHGSVDIVVGDDGLRARQ
jgi:hypothetical protein